MRKSYNRKNSV